MSEVGVEYPGRDVKVGPPDLDNRPTVREVVNRHGSKHVVDFVQIRFANALVENDLATVHGNDTVTALEDVMDVVTDKDAGHVLLFQ